VQAAAQPPESGWRGLATVVGPALSLALLVTTLVGFLGAWWWAFDLLANLRLHQFVALLLLALVLAALRSRFGTAVAAFGLVLNVAAVGPTVLATEFREPPPAAPDARPLGVTFFNTKFRADRDATIAALASRDDDVVVLALAVGSWGEDLAGANLGGLHVRTGPHLDADRDFGLVAMTRDPEAEVVVHRRTDDPRDAVVEIVVEHDGGPIHVLAAHPTSPTTAERAEGRDRMLDWIADRATARNAPVVVIGDLNATTWSAPMRRLLREADLVDSRVGHGLQPTWPVALGRLGLAIDHVLHSDEMTTLVRRLTRIDGSDHAMVHARLARRAPGG
jgi:endonuclease/exonuclease/phosphatase (EEP) superfamily protein YafD